MGSAVLFILMSILLLYSAGSGVNTMQVTLSVFSVRLFCFVLAKTLCRYGCMYFLAALAMIVSFCLPSTVDVNALIICSGLCTCTEML